MGWSARENLEHRNTWTATRAEGRPLVPRPLSWCGRRAVARAAPVDSDRGRNRVPEIPEIILRRRTGTGPDPGTPFHGASRSRCGPVSTGRERSRDRERSHRVERDPNLRLVLQQGKVGGQSAGDRIRCPHRSPETTCGPHPEKGRGPGRTTGVEFGAATDWVAPHRLGCWHPADGQIGEPAAVV